MSAYLVVEHVITDSAKFEEYRTKVAPMITMHGGCYLTKGGGHKFPEGGHWRPERVVVIEFPNMEALKWRHSTLGTPRLSISHSLHSESSARATSTCSSLSKVSDGAA